MRLDAPIKELTFNDGHTLKLRKDSIVVFVGPNNAGKTACLCNIYCHPSGDSNCNLVSSIDFTKTNLEDAQSLLDEIAIVKPDNRLTSQFFAPFATYQAMDLKGSCVSMASPTNRSPSTIPGNNSDISYT